MTETISEIFNSWVQSDTAALWALTAWIATFFAGESGAILVLSFAFGGFMSLPLATLFVFAGSFSADMFWYIVTTSTLRPWFEKHIRRKSETQNERTTFAIEIAKNHPYIILLLIKFLVGLRLILTIYIAARKDIPFRRYLICNLVANTLFVAVLLGISYAITASIGTVTEIKDNISYVITLIVVVGIASQFILRIFERVVSKILTKTMNG